MTNAIVLHTDNPQTHVHTDRIYLVDTGHAVAAGTVVLVVLGLLIWFFFGRRRRT